MAGSPAGNGLTNFIGSYTLRVVDGAMLPAGVADITGPAELGSGSLVLAADGRFVMSDSLRSIAPSVSTGFSRTYSGTYVTSDTDITLVYGRMVATGHLKGDELTLLRGAPTYGYRRR